MPQSGCPAHDGHFPRPWQEELRLKAASRAPVRDGHSPRPWQGRGCSRNVPAGGVGLSPAGAGPPGALRRRDRQQACRTAGASPRSAWREGRVGGQRRAVAARSRRAWARGRTRGPTRGCPSKIPARLGAWARGLDKRASGPDCGKTPARLGGWIRSKEQPGLNAVSRRVRRRVVLALSGNRCENRARRGPRGSPARRV